MLNIKKSIEILLIKKIIELTPIKIHKRYQEQINGEYSYKNSKEVKPNECYYNEISKKVLYSEFQKQYCLDKFIKRDSWNRKLRIERDGREKIKNSYEELIDRIYEKKQQ